MTTPASVAITAGAGTKIATFEITEGGETREIQRIVLCDALGNEIGSLISGNAISTSPSPVEVGPFTPKQIAAGQTTAVLGATGAAGDYLSHIVIQPATTSPGAVTLYDGTTTVIYSFPGGASSLSNLSPIIIGIASKCANAGWHITTGASVSVSAFGSFT